MVFYPESRIVNNCLVERTFLVRFTAGPVYGREGLRRLCPEVQPVTLIIHHFLLREKVPLSYSFYWKMVLLSHAYSLELSIPFNCCNSLSLKYSWIDPKTGTFLRLFHSDKMHLLFFFKPFYYRNLRFSYPFIYLKWRNPWLSFHVPEAWKSYWEYPSFPGVFKQNMLPLLLAWTREKKSGC